MLDKEYQEKFTPRVKQEANKLLQELGIERFSSESSDGKSDTSSGTLLELLDSKICGLVTLDEVEHQSIDRELLAIYDLLSDIISDNETDIEFLNQLFFE